MKKLTNILQLLLLVSTLALSVGCEPNGDRNSTDTDNPLQEPAKDSTRYPGGADDYKIGDSSLTKDSLNM